MRIGRVVSLLLVMNKYGSRTSHRIIVAIVVEGWRHRVRMQPEGLEAQRPSNAHD